MGNTYKYKFYAKWLFENEAIAREAIEELIANEEVVCSFGVGEKQYEGYDATDGEFTFNDTEIDGKTFCFVQWMDDAECVDEDYWLSPYCFENYETYNVDGTTARGEEFDFGKVFEMGF